MKRILKLVICLCIIASMLIQLSFPCVASLSLPGNIIPYDKIEGLEYEQIKSLSDLIETAIIKKNYDFHSSCYSQSLDIDLMKFSAAQLLELQNHLHQLLVSLRPETLDQLLGLWEQDDISEIGMEHSLSLLRHDSGDEYVMVHNEKEYYFSSDEMKIIQQWLDGNYIPCKDEADAENSSIDDKSVSYVKDELEGAVICDFKKFTITVTKAKLRKHILSGDIDLILYVDIINNNDFEYEGYIESVAVNDWQVEHVGWFNLRGGRKQKDELILKLNDIGVSDLEDIETLSISFKLLYAYYSTETDEVILHLK